MNAVICPYQPQHFDGVDLLWRESFPDDPVWNRAALAIPAKLVVQPELFLVALDEGQVIGSILAGYDGHRGWLYALAVRAADRGQGVGTDLVRAAEQRLDCLGCRKINLQVRSTNAQVISFYETLGYSVEDRVSMGKRSA